MTIFKDFWVSVKQETGVLFAFISSIIAFGLFFIITFYYTEERILNEGAKELVGIINSGDFLLIHPERFVFVITQALPVVGLNLGVSLKSLIYLYSFNTLVFAFSIFCFCILLKDYVSGLYLTAINLVGISYGFFWYPFSEQVYALCFSYFLFLWIYRFRDDHPLLLHSVALPLIIFICALHPNCIFYVAIVLLAVPIGIKEKVGYGTIALLVFASTILLTDIEAQGRLHTLQWSAILEPFSQLAREQPLTLLLFLAVMVMSWFRKNTLAFFMVLLASSYPLWFYGQIPITYNTVPSGVAILFIATWPRIRMKRLTIIMILAIIVLSVFHIHSYKDQVQGLRKSIGRLIELARQQNGNKFILVENERNKDFIRNDLALSLEGAIKHSSLLFSSLEGPSKTVMIEDYAFNRTFLLQPALIKRDDSTIINEITSLYDLRDNQELQKEIGSRYLYAKYFFSDQAINTDYFGIEALEPYRILQFPKVEIDRNR